MVYTCYRYKSYGQVIAKSEIPEKCKRLFNMKMKKANSRGKSGSKLIEQLLLLEKNQIDSVAIIAFLINGYLTFLLIPHIFRTPSPIIQNLDYLELTEMIATKTNFFNWDLSSAINRSTSGCNGTIMLAAIEGLVKKFLEFFN